MKLDYVLQTPGIWVCASGRTAFFLEVADDLICHQLDPETLERDGELEPDGWSDEARIEAGFCGPLQRKVNANESDRRKGDI